jgi:chromosome segregation ATPase
MVTRAASTEAREERLLGVLERLERRVEHIEAAVNKLEGATAQVPAVVATLTDIVDGLVERLAARGVDVDERLHALLRAADHLTSPRALDALASMLSSEIMAHQTTEVIGRMGRAIVAAEHQAQPMGAWGLWRALRDPEVQRAAGFLVAMARRFGEELEAVPQLPAGGDA